MWHLTSGNTNMTRFERFMEHRGHLERLAQIKTGINNKQPKTPSFIAKGMINPGSRMERALKIKYENQVIYNRMYDLLNRLSPYNRLKTKPSKCPAYELLTYHRLRKNLDIKIENNKLHKRYVSAKPTYVTNKLKKEYKYCQYLEKNISENRNRANPNIEFIGFKKFNQNIINCNKFIKNRSNSSLNNSLDQFGSYYSTKASAFSNCKDDGWFKGNSKISKKKKFKRPNSCKPNIAVSKDIQEQSELYTEQFNNTSAKSFKTKPTSGKTRTNGSASTNVVTVTSP